jgi:hypothetical protein
VQPASASNAVRPSLVDRRLGARRIPLLSISSAPRKSVPAGTLSGGTPQTAQWFDRAMVRGD